MAASHYYKSLIFVPKSYFTFSGYLLYRKRLEGDIFLSKWNPFYGKNQRKFTEIRDNVSETKY